MWLTQTQQQQSTLFSCVLIIACVSFCSQSFVFVSHVCLADTPREGAVGGTGVPNVLDGGLRGRRRYGHPRQVRAGDLRKKAYLPCFVSGLANTFGPLALDGSLTDVRTWLGDPCKFLVWWRLVGQFSDFLGVNRRHDVLGGT